MKIAITGANGFIGSAIQKACEHQGISTIGLCRKPVRTDDLQFDMMDPSSFAQIPHDLSALVHTAYSTQAKDLKQAHQANIAGSLALFAFCHRVGIPIVFLSSCSAHEQARSIYGQSKYQLEGHLSEQDVIIRPGFVIGPGGVYQRLEKSLRTLKFAPLFWGGQQPLQTIALEDLIQGIVTILTEKRRGVFNLVHPTPCPMQEFYRKIFRKLRMKPRFIKLSGDLTLWGLRLAEFLRIPLPMTSENLLGLKHMRVWESDCDKLGIEPRKFT